MAETCIVCLGDLATTDECLHQSSRSADLAPPAAATTANDAQLAGKTPLSSTVAVADDSSVIAHIVPCGHNLHNDCLKPWVERANSCPICRQNFNVVELVNYVDGPIISSYAVDDKKQVAEIDPSMIIDDDLFDEPDFEACLFCDEFGDEETLLLCDGCNAACHTYCVGLDSVPAGQWFCPSCMENRVLQSLHQPSTSARRSTRRRRAPEVRGEQTHAWARVWQSVWDNLNIDLDFPFDDDTSAGRRTQAQEREFAQWQRRFAIAERHGGAARFRDTATTLLDLRTGHSGGQTPQPESQDELRAWNAFDKARELNENELQASSSRKRKSATASPAEPLPEPPRPLKRPRTRRAPDTGDMSSDAGAESSHAPRHDREIPTPTAVRPAESGHGGPSFLHSLLKEVENSPAPSESSLRLQRPTHPGSPGPLDCASPASSMGSPVSSNHPSPQMRPASPYPSHQSRPSSPPLTSRIEPIFIHHPPQFSPASPSAQPPLEASEPLCHSPKIIEQSHPRRPHPSWAETHDAKSPSSNGLSSTVSRRGMSSSDKAEIQHMVTAALKPEYKKGQIDTEQYTEVNRDVSRMLYDKIGEAGGLVDGGGRDKWQTLAATEVDAALRRLKKREVVSAA